MNFYKNVLYITKGLNEYTGFGYSRACKKFNPDDLEVDCEGKIYMITGANRGLGKHLAYELAKRGGTIHMVCRNKKRGEETMKDLKIGTRNQKIFLHVVDMSEPTQVSQFAQKFREENSNLNVLINNAGSLYRTKKLNSLGMEMQFAVHTLGVHILTTLLTPLLNNSLEPRVIMVSFSGLLLQKLNYVDLNHDRMLPYDGTQVFCQNKRRQTVLAERYSELYPGIHFSSMHPGWVDTPGIRENCPDFYNAHLNRLRPTKQGADTIIWLAISSKAIKHSSGLFFQDRRPVSPHLLFFNTKISIYEEVEFISMLDSLMEKHKSP